MTRLYQMLSRKTQNLGKKIKTKRKNQKSPFNEYVKYSSLGFQMLVVIMIAVFGGMEIDKMVKGLEFPLFTVLFSLIGVVLSIYYAIKDFARFK
ncbi:MAG: AtpZ/AtpI family protein [Bacteroidota bacterium]